MLRKSDGSQNRDKKSGRQQQNTLTQNSSYRAIPGVNSDYNGNSASPQMRRELSLKSTIIGGSNKDPHYMA